MFGRRISETRGFITLILRHKLPIRIRRMGSLFLGSLGEKEGSGHDMVAKGKRYRFRAAANV